MPEKSLVKGFFVLLAAEYVGARGTIYVSGSLYLLGECLVELGETGALDEIFRRSTTSSSKIDKH